MPEAFRGAVKAGELQGKFEGDKDPQSNPFSLILTDEGAKIVEVIQASPAERFFNLKEPVVIERVK